MCFSCNRAALIPAIFLLVAMLGPVGHGLADDRGIGGLRPLQLEITTHLGDQQTFRAGDRLQFMLSLDRSAHVTLLYQDSVQVVMQLLPNRYRPSDRFDAGLFVAFPGPDAEFELVVKAPFGEDRVWAFASDVPIPELPGQPMKSGLTRVSLSIDQVRDLIRQHSQRFFDEALLRISTSP